MDKYYKCEVCGNEFKVVNDGGVVPVCCGREMTECDKPSGC